MRQDDAHADLVDQVQLRDQGFEIMPIGTQTVQPDETGLWLLRRVDLYGIEYSRRHAA
jgi:hypothetical protein